MSNKAKHLLVCGCILISMTASVTSIASPALAQARSTISRLPTAIYLPNAARERMTAPAREVKDLSELPGKSISAADLAAPIAAAESGIQAFVAQNARELGLDGNAATLALKDIRQTLSGRHFTLEQRLDGIPIIDAQVQVTVNDQGVVQSMTRNVVDVPVTAAASVRKTATIDTKAAEDIAWNDLRATGEFLEQPQTDKAYLNENNVLTLVYVVKLAVSQPFGYWEYVVDANTGRIISKRDRRIKEDKQKRELSAEAVVEWPPAAVAIGNRSAMLANLDKRMKDMSAAAKAESKVATGKALIFEPNPISTLGDGNLQDGDAPTKFDRAYVEVKLEGLKDIAGTLHLQGPLVRIEDFERGEGSASRPPSTTVGAWTGRRGNNAFNDVMTYYHLHSSLNYLRKLGYLGATDLFPTGIAADSDGVNGDDNSHYVPGSDRLAFGHGCVDDNEDTDVIMHELGHAIHFHLTPNWRGGDSGAIGEGFGDYWAVSQRMRMKNGLALDSGKVFVWDGIAACWPGRRVDRLNAKYDPGRTYFAHQNMGGFVSDELWSTPLVSSLFELVNAGETHDSVDQVVLEGMAGVGLNFTMRTLALRTVERAAALFPGKPHAAVFEKHFKHHEIIK